ncbi:MAG: hypothetical protein ACTS27_11890 [Phycisphaerales bacterium]
MADQHAPDQPKKSALGLTCNIDRSGKRARAIAGALLLVGAAGAFYAAAVNPSARVVGIVAGVSAAIGGAFCLFEAANGWCAVRAMGFKTKL